MFDLYSGTGLIPDPCTKKSELQKFPATVPGLAVETQHLFHIEVASLYALPPEISRAFVTIQGRAFPFIPKAQKNQTNSKDCLQFPKADRLRFSSCTEHTESRTDRLPAPGTGLMSFTRLRHSRGRISC